MKIKIIILSIFLSFLQGSSLSVGTPDTSWQKMDLVYTGRYTLQLLGGVISICVGCNSLGDKNMTSLGLVLSSVLILGGINSVYDASQHLGNHHFSIPVRPSK
jgi:hypothetical protein